MLAKLRSTLILALAVLGLNLVFGLSDLINHFYRNGAYLAYHEQASGRFVVVSLDDGVANRPLPTGEQARLINVLRDAGARTILLDMPLEAGIDKVGDQRLTNAIVSLGDNIVLVNRAKVDALKGSGEIRDFRFQIPPGTRIALSNWNVNFAGFFESTPSSFELGTARVPSVAALVAGVPSEPVQSIYPAYRIDPASVPVRPVEAVLRGSDPAGTFAGKTIFVTRTGLDPTTAMGYYSHRRQPPVFADISGIHGAAGGQVFKLGDGPLLLLLLVCAILSRRFDRKRWKVLVYTGFAAALLVVPLVSMEAGLPAMPGLAIVAAMVYGPVRLWEKWRRHLALTSAASGLPNIEALAAQGIASSHDVVAASISHYEQMMASLPRELHGECARQIARRLSIASGESQVYDSDNGHFVWLTQPYSTDALVAQLEGLKALFAAPLLIGRHVLDTNIHFGLDRNADSAPISRIKSAIVGSTEAQAKGKLYEEFGSKRLAETQWELSLHARIDEALRNGDIWLAFQGQYDFATNEIRSAETLIRWTDPERGPIPPDSFILQAERAGRIDTLTYWVLEQAMLASKVLLDEVGEIRLGVNLSAWMVDQPSLVQSVSDIVRRHRYDCTRITFEVTETFSMSNRELAKRNLSALRAMGFKLSIDDFGTGQSGLAYLAEIPSDELKLDKRFIQAIVKSKRDRVIVSNTIRLAHDLGQQVVAEGVEDLAIFEALRGLGCDVAQGYFIGRPVPLRDFVAELKTRAFDQMRYG